MKIAILTSLLVSFIVVSCNKSTPETPVPSPGPGQGEGSSVELTTEGNVTGQWHLKEWDNKVSADVYVSFAENGTFELYQKTFSLGYEHFSGTYVYENNVISGKYSDGIRWGRSYSVKYTVDGTEMYFTDTENASDLSVYEKSDIPEDILSGKLETKTSVEENMAASYRFL